VSLRQFAHALASGFSRLFAPRIERRRLILSAPFPQAWQKFLESRSVHYRRLPISYRAEFHQQAQIFLAEKRITGVEMHVSEETKLLVAASAVMLTVGWPGHAWDKLAEVLVYPDDFDRDYRFGGTDYSGQAHPWGTVILSVPALEERNEGGQKELVVLRRRTDALELHDGIPRWQRGRESSGDAPGDLRLRAIDECGENVVRGRAARAGRSSGSRTSTWSPCRCPSRATPLRWSCRPRRSTPATTGSSPGAPAWTPRVRSRKTSRSTAATSGWGTTRL